MMNVEMKDNALEYKKRLEVAINRYLTEAGMFLESEAKEELENAPRRVDTGLLRNSITYALSGKNAAISSYHASYGKSMDKSGKRYGTASPKAESVGVGFYSGTAPTIHSRGDGVYIGTNVEYAMYVHEGTDRMAPNRFLKNAIEKNQEQLRQKLIDIISETFNV